MANTNFGQLKLSAGPGFALTGAFDQVVLKFDLGYSFMLVPKDLLGG